MILLAATIKTGTISENEGFPRVFSKCKKVYIMKIAIACDHAGFTLKEQVKVFLQNAGHEILDFGTSSEESCDLSDHIYPAAIAVAKSKAQRGIFIDGVGYGSALIANKISGLYAAVCQDPFCAQLARSHSNTNILCIGAKLIGSGIAMEIVNAWMTTEFLCDQEKYKKRVDKVVAISEAHIKPLFRCEIDKQEQQIDSVLAMSEKYQCHKPLEIVAS